MWEAPLVQVVMDKALTVLSNFKLSSGCELEALRCWEIPCLNGGCSSGKIL